MDVSRIELDLVLEGEDARRLKDYLKHPEKYYTKEGREMDKWIDEHGDELIASIK